MVAELMDEHVGDHLPQSVLVLRPVIENGAAVEEDGVRQLPRKGGGTVLRQPDAGEQPHQFERVVDPQFVEHVVVGELSDVAPHLRRQLFEGIGQGIEGSSRHLLEIIERRCPPAGPHFSIFDSGHSAAPLWTASARLTPLR